MIFYKEIEMKMRNFGKIAIYKFEPIPIEKKLIPIRIILKLKFYK